MLDVDAYLSLVSVLVGIVLAPDAAVELASVLKAVDFV